jgi:GNAT superfamily N-acetyltransferase
VVNNSRYEMQHKRRPAHFFFLDAEDSPEIFTALFRAAADWARTRGCVALEGPMLFGGTYGSGVLIDGFETPAPLTMMPYNFRYYALRLEELGFEKLFDLVGADISPAHFSLPAKVESVAEKVRLRGRFKVLEFKRKADIASRADEIATLYNATLADHYENYPLTEAELEFVKNDLLSVADPRLVKILEYDGKIVGFLFAFHDLNPALRRNMGKVTPLGILRLLIGYRQRRKVFFNGMGIMEEYQRLGGNALLYSELTRTVSSMGFTEAETVQINEHTDLMLADIKRLGAIITKRHRVFTRKISSESD